MKNLELTKSILQEDFLIIHFRPMFLFYTPWKHQKTKGFLVLSGGYKMGTLTGNGLISKVKSM